MIYTKRIVLFIFFLRDILDASNTLWEGVLPYIGSIGMSGPKGHGFSAVLVINRYRLG